MSTPPSTGVTTGIAFVGCGYVADMYMETLPWHPDLRLTGVWDRDPARLAAFAAHHRVRAYGSEAEMLADPAVDLVVNLTNPRNHVPVTRAALEAGKHVYSEKPLAMTVAEAESLAALAAARGLGLAAAPCNHLADGVQALAAALRAGRLGKVLLAYAEMDDGMIPGLDYAGWRSASGAPWPARDEFEVGCTLEHAGYQIAPLVALFGPVRRVTAHAACLLPDKGNELGVAVRSPDLTIGILEFDDGVVARLTNSILAPMDRSLTVVGAAGVARVMDVWEYTGPVRVSATGKSFRSRLLRKIEKTLAAWAPGLVLGRALPLPGKGRVGRLGGGHRMDFARGIAALAAATRGGPPVVSAALAVHVTEVTLALQHAPRLPQPCVMTSDPGVLPPVMPGGSPR